MIINFGSVFKKDFIKAKQAGFTNKIENLLHVIKKILIKHLRLMKSLLGTHQDILEESMCNIDWFMKLKVIQSGFLSVGDIMNNKYCL